MNPVASSKKLYKKISYKIFLGEKRIYQYHKFLRSKSNSHLKKILFIVGCQRSGTTIMLKTLEKDVNTKIYGEESKLSSIQGYRLNPLDMVKKEIDRDKAELIVIKPLVESQNILQLIKAFEASKAVWMYRDYKDVASSNLNLFGIKNGINDIRPIVENQPDNWRNEKVSDGTRKIVKEYFSEDMNPYDAAVLFWYARNSHFFELELDKHPDIIMCKYEKLITNPTDVVSNIYKNIEQYCEIKKIIKDINSNSLMKGRNIDLSPEVSNLAAGFLDKLDAVYYRQTGLPTATS